MHEAGFEQTIFAEQKRERSLKLMVMCVETSITFFFLLLQLKCEHKPFLKSKTMIMIDIYSHFNKKHKLVNINILNQNPTIKAFVIFFSIGFVTHIYLHNCHLYKFVINTFQAGRY